MNTETRVRGSAKSAKTLSSYAYLRLAENVLRHAAVLHVVPDTRDNQLILENSRERLEVNLTELYKELCE